MQAQHKGWGYSAGVNDEESCGEGLSQFLTVQFQISIGQGQSRQLRQLQRLAQQFAAGEQPRVNRVRWNHTLWLPHRLCEFDSAIRGQWPRHGWLAAVHLLSVSAARFLDPVSIVGAAPGLDSSNNPIGGSCLRGVYRNLTGDTSDPFPYFAGLLAAAFPPDQVSSIPGSNGDDPWPLGSLSFVGAKNTWGHDEINDIISKGGTYPDGIYLALEGFSKNIVAGAVPTLPTIAFGGVTAVPSATPPAIFYQSSNPKVPQRIMFAYDVKFAQPLGTFPTSGETPAAVSSSINVLTKPFPAATEFFFLAGADPYFTNVVKIPATPRRSMCPGSART